MKNGKLAGKVAVVTGASKGIISLLVLAVAVFARYARQLVGAWRKTYVVTSVLALYFNVFVLIVQSFQKIPALKSIAPTQNDPPFKLTQLVVLIAFIVLGIFAATRFRVGPAPSTLEARRSTRSDDPANAVTPNHGRSDGNLG
jgi:hypothetical protein